MARGRQEARTQFLWNSEPALDRRQGRVAGTESP
jgi:hypothetical protein